jgi:hypothetical protein
MASIAFPRTVVLPQKGERIVFRDKDFFISALIVGIAFGMIVTAVWELLKWLLS